MKPIKYQEYYPKKPQNYATYPINKIAESLVYTPFRSNTFYASTNSDLKLYNTLQNSNMELDISKFLLLH